MWILGGMLESLYWLPLDFGSNILTAGGVLRIVFLLKNECNLSGGDNQILLAVLKKSNFMHSQAPEYQL